MSTGSGTVSYKVPKGNNLDDFESQISKSSGNGSGGSLKIICS